MESTGCMYHERLSELPGIDDETRYLSVTCYLLAYVFGASAVLSILGNLVGGNPFALVPWLALLVALFFVFMAKGMNGEYAHDPGDRVELISVPEFFGFVALAMFLPINRTVLLNVQIIAWLVVALCALGVVQTLRSVASEPKYAS